MQPSTGSRSALVGISLYIGSMAAIALMDAIVKHLVAEYHFSQIVFFRSLFALLPIFAYSLVERRRLVLPADHFRLHFARVVSMFVATALFFVSLIGLKLGQAAAISLLAPVLMTGLSVLFARDSVTPGRCVVLLIGLAGGLLIVNPFALSWHGTGGFYVGLALASTMFYEVTMILTKVLASRGEARNMLLTTPLGVALLSVPVALGFWQEWSGDYPYFLAAGIFGGLATILAIRAVEFASISTIAPFDYTIFLFAAAIGYGVWRESLDLTVWLGVALVAASMLVIRIEDRLPKA